MKLIQKSNFGVQGMFYTWAQTWNLSKILHRRIFRPKTFHRQFHLISTVLVIKTQKNEWKWRNLHRWQKFYTAAGTDGTDKFQLCQPGWEEMEILKGNLRKIGEIWGNLKVNLRVSNSEWSQPHNSSHPAAMMQSVGFLVGEWIKKGLKEGNVSTLIV